MKPAVTKCPTSKQQLRQAQTWSSFNSPSPCFERALSSPKCLLYLVRLLHAAAFTLLTKTDAIWAASPSTTRGQPTPLSSDPKGERIAYAVSSRNSASLGQADSRASVRQIHLPPLHRQPLRQQTVHATHRPNHRRPFLSLRLLCGKWRCVWSCQGVGLCRRGRYKRCVDATVEMRRHKRAQRRTK